MTIFQGLGRALRLLRDRRGRSQKEVAAAAGITPPMLSAYENERTSPEIDTLDKILHQGLDAALVDLEWALDVVNQRPAHRDPRGPLSTAGAAGERPGDLLDVRMLSRLASGGTLSPALEEGYAEIVRGLLKISRAVFESVAGTQEGEGRGGEG